MQPAAPGSRADMFLGIGSVLLALVIALIWAVYDSGSGLTETLRRQIMLGDALAPSVAAGFIGLGGMILMVPKRAAGQPGLGRANWMFLLHFLAICAMGLGAMRWGGPLAVALIDPFVAADLDYRNLRDTAPWKYIGFLSGGTFMVAALIARSEGRLSPRAIVIAITVIAVLIGVIDLPFDDLQLPPNGDL